MFYSEAILSRRGPLAKVWLAAHMERKLSKTQTLQTDIEQAADAIMGQEIEVMALRLSGQLLLGVVRIYSRKAKYLLDDCNEALLKIKMAFRPGMVDMTEDQLAVNRNAITLQGGNIDLDVLLPDINWDVDFEDRPIGQQPGAGGGQHVARMADITLATADDFNLDLDDPGYGWDLGPSDGIGSADYDNLDLGLDFGDGAESVEMGRDGPASHAGRESIDSHLLGGGDGDLDLLSNKSREVSENPFGADMNIDMGMDMDFGPDVGGMDIDLGLDFGGQTPGQTRSPSRHSSPLSEGPKTPGDDVNLTPRAAANEDAKAKRKPKEKKQIIDSVTELEDGPGAKAGRGRNAGLGAALKKDVSGIITEHHFLPRSAIVMRLLEIREDPLAHFLPTKTTPNGTFFCAAPPGLAPELSEMFMRPLNHAINPKRRGASPSGRGPNKKPRLEEDEDVEQGVRAGSVAPSIGLGSDALGGRGDSIGPVDGFDFGDNTGMGMDDFQMDLGLGGEDGERGKTPLTDLSRLSTPMADGMDGEETSYANAECLIAGMDSRPSQQTQSQSQAVEKDAAEGEGKGYSKNTVKALGIIRKELQPTADEGEQEEEEKVLSFRKMADKASRRAASSFFFELLVLGTRDCVQLSQPKPFENIEIRAKDKLWERQRHGSVAQSVASGMGL